MTHSERAITVIFQEPHDPPSDDGTLDIVPQHPVSGAWDSLQSDMAT